MSRHPGRRWIVEGFVVVVSILIAFALDAWWDARSARQDLAADLRGVADELVDNRDALAIRIDGYREIVSSIDYLLSLDSVRARDGAVTVADTILFRSFVTSPTTDPSMGVLDALIASGRIALVEDLSLRRFLAGFRTRIEDVREDELGARQVAHERIFPLFEDDPAALAATSILRYDAGFDVDVVTFHTLDFDDERWTRIRSALGLRHFWMRNAINEGELFLADMDRALEVLAGY